MPNCKVNVDAKANPIAHGIYQDLNKLGVSCESMDQGYNVTNYAKKYCADKTVRNCILSKGDGVVGSDEVLEYALNNYDKYRQVIEGRLGSPLPWVLDDLDPNTKFDAEIRARVDAAIKELKKIITSKGITEGSPEYKEKMAAGLLWFVAAPTTEAISMGRAQGNPWIQLLEKGMENDGLKDFLNYLDVNDGLRVGGDDSEEYSALEAIAKKQGECTEMSKILFAVLKMAELAPEFVHEDIKKESIQNPLIRDLIAKAPEGMSHMCIGLNTGGRLRFLDSMFLSSNAHYAHYTLLSPRQYLSADYSNRGDAWGKKGELDKAIADLTKAIEVDPKLASAYTGRGSVWGAKGELDKAVADFTKAIEIDPIDAIAYYNRGNVWGVKGELDKAMGDYTRAIDLDFKFVSAIGNRSVLRIRVMDLKGASQDMSELLKLTGGSYDAHVKGLATALIPHWEKRDIKPMADRFYTDTSVKIAEAIARMILCYAFWVNGDKDEALEKLGDLTMELAPTQKPAPATTEFLKKILDAMPGDMKRDKRAKDAIKSLNKYQ